MTTVADMENNYLSTTAVAEQLGVNPETVRRWIAAGKLRAIRMSATTYRIPSDSLAAFLEARQVSA